MTHETDSRRTLVPHIHTPFGGDSFGKRAEEFARFFGTPRFLIGQTIVVAAWIVVNALAVAFRWDPYPFILLNLMFSLQAAYAAPLILLAQTRQADRDKHISESDTAHREALATAAIHRQEIAAAEAVSLHKLLEQNTILTQRVEELTREIHQRVVANGGG